MHALAYFPPGEEWLQKLLRMELLLIRLIQMKCFGGTTKAGITVNHIWIIRALRRMVTFVTLWQCLLPVIEIGENLAENGLMATIARASSFFFDSGHLISSQPKNPE